MNQPPPCLSWVDSRRLCLSIDDGRSSVKRNDKQKRPASSDVDYLWLSLVMLLVVGWVIFVVQSCVCVCVCRADFWRDFFPIPSDERQTMSKAIRDAFRVSMKVSTTVVFVGRSIVCDNVADHHKKTTTLLSLSWCLWCCPVTFLIRCRRVGCLYSLD